MKQIEIDGLHKLNLKSLEYHRVVADLILMYKTCHHLTNLAFSDFFVYHIVYSLRQHNWMIQSISSTTTHPSSQLLQYKHFFISDIPAI